MYPDIALESKLAVLVRSYLQAALADDSFEQQEALKQVCAGLEYLLGSLLETCDGWSGFVDGIMPATDFLPDAVSTSATALNVRGSALWSKRTQGPFWIEPFLACVRASDAGDSLISYQLQFGDAARGLGTHPYGKHIRRADWFCPTEWMFSFSKEGVA